MTILAAYTAPSGDIWIGSDGRLCCNGTIERDDSQKWTIGDGGAWAVGIAGYAGVLQIAAAEAGKQYAAGLEGIVPAEQNPQRFAECMRRLLSEIGWHADSQRGDAPHRDQDLVLVMGGKVWDVDLGLGIALEMGLGLWCWGSGGTYALGAAHAAEFFEASPLEVVRCAIRAAIRFDRGCGGEPWVWRM